MRRLLLLIIATVFAVMLLPACGRSGIDAEEFSVVNTRCNAESCPAGCCDENGACRNGTDLVRCGSGGKSCGNCAGQGFDLCEPSTKTCGREVVGCSERTCATGCCTVQGGKEVCVIGTDSAACGTSGRTCESCTNRGQSCDAGSKVCSGVICDARSCPNGCCNGAVCVSGRELQVCGSSGSRCENCGSRGQICAASAAGVGGVCGGVPSCSAANCDGCCSGNVCLPGADDTACGVSGAACSVCDGKSQCAAATRRCTTKPACGPGNCAGCCQGDTCVLPGNGDAACGRGGDQCANCGGTGQVCEAFACKRGCDAGNCPNGCCRGNTCVVGNQDLACGRGGALCNDCAAAGQSCAAGVCQATCNAMNCPGCCQNNICQAGFLNNRCGSNGVSCTDCAGAGSTCDTNQLPRVCVGAGTCPAPYAACPAATTTSQPVVSRVCTAATLNDARVACTAGPNTPACANYFQFLAATAATCGTCLADFRYNFRAADSRGVFKCAAPFLSPACNANTGCATDCETRSCLACASTVAENSCRTAVRAGQCQSFALQTACVTSALVGAAAFCNPATYAGNFGAWLQGVAARYCAAP